MFCSFLRRRPSCVAILPKLTGSSGLHLREAQLETYDIALPLGSTVVSCTGNTLIVRELRLLLLSPSRVVDHKLAETLQRVQDLISLTHGRDIAIIFLLSPSRDTTFASAKLLTQTHAPFDTQSGSEGVIAYAKLQAEVIDQIKTPCVPIFPVADLDGLPDLLHKLASKTAASQLSAPVASPSELLPHCTTHPPLRQEMASVLTNLFNDLKDLARASTNPACIQAEGNWPLGDAASELQTIEDDAAAAAKSESLRHLIGENEWKGIMDFWTDEWLAD